MKEIRKKIADLNNYLDVYWYGMIPSYLKLSRRDLFEIDFDIFSEIENIKIQ